ncbi:MAG: trypsin-like peptidase domain-containing protein [Candidatus Obscuribacterales bacterium]|nr:trypsin-like peptidase domain-containing protein [Candidatus Obscuribacterales bacterium]
MTSLPKKMIKSPSNFIYLGSGLVLGAVIFWAGHLFWPEKSNSTTSETQSQKKDDRTTIFTGALGESTIADIAAVAEPTVVNIDTRTSVVVADTPYHQGLPLGLFFGNEALSPVPRRLESRGAGSGFIIRSDGYILTNNHVVENWQEIRVTVNDQRQFEGKVVGRDTTTDLALIKINAKNLPVASFGDSNKLRPGDWVIAIGSPLGLGRTVTLGIVSALGRSIGNLNQSVQLIQTDAAINPGNSGGPLLNIHGEVVGVNTAIRGDAQNIGFAIPVSLAKDVARQLLEKGRVAHPYLGIYMQTLDRRLAKSLGLSQKLKGVLVVQLQRTGPAARGGLRPADLVVGLEGKQVSTSEEVQTCLSSHKPGDKVEFVVIRDGKRIPLSVEIGEIPQVLPPR